MRQDQIKVGIVGYGVIGETFGRWLKEHTACRIAISDPPKGLNDDLTGCSVFFIGIHIPTEADGTQDLTLLRSIIAGLPENKPIFIRTTLLPGTADMLSKETTTLRRKAYKETHPLFTKTDLAKYENTWDQLPYCVSEGAQKNFKKFTMRLAERGNYVPDAKYYERLIAKAILFRRTEKLVQQQQYGGYRANIVTYTIAYLSHVTGQRIDLDAIWRNQSLTPALEENIVEVSKFVQRMIVNPPGGANVGEWCKKQQCWNAIKEYSYDITETLRAELVDVANAADVISSSSKATVSSLNVTTEDEKMLIDKAFAISAAEWYALSKWAKETNNFQGWQRSIIFSVAQLVARNRKPSYKQAVQVLKIYEEAIDKGFNKL